MLTLVVRTDKPEAEIGLCQDGKMIAIDTWQAHRMLAETLHSRLQAMLKSQQLTWDSIEGIVCYKGPGSFTGLRIGLSVANALALGLNVPIVSETGDAWIEQGAARLVGGDDEKSALPEYGSPVHITTPKK